MYLLVSDIQNGEECGVCTSSLSSRPPPPPLTRPPPSPAAGNQTDVKKVFQAAMCSMECSHSSQPTPLIHWRWLFFLADIVRQLCSLTIIHRSAPPKPRPVCQCHHQVPFDRWMPLGMIFLHRKMHLWWILPFIYGCWHPFFIFSSLSLAATHPLPLHVPTGPCPIHLRSTYLSPPIVGPRLRGHLVSLGPGGTLLCSWVVSHPVVGLQCAMK